MEQPTVLQCQARVDAAKACRVFSNLCVVAGCRKSLMYRELLYVVVADARGEVCGIPLASPLAPVHHSLKGGSVAGFWPEQITSLMEFEGRTEGFKAILRPDETAFQLELRLARALAEARTGVVLRRLLGRLGGAQEIWIA